MLVPKTLSWADIVLPTSWKLEKTIPPKISLRKPENIIEAIVGVVEIIFDIIKETKFVDKSLDNSASNVKGIYVST